MLQGFQEILSPPDVRWMDAILHHTGNPGMMTPLQIPTNTRNPMVSSCEVDVVHPHVDFFPGPKAESFRWLAPRRLTGGLAAAGKGSAGSGAHRGGGLPGERNDSVTPVHKIPILYPGSSSKASIPRFLKQGLTCQGLS